MRVSRQVVVLRALTMAALAATALSAGLGASAFTPSTAGGPARRIVPPMIFTPESMGDALAVVADPRGLPPGGGALGLVNSEITPVYAPEVPEVAKTPIGAALDRWALALDIRVPVVVKIDWEDIPGALAGAGPAAAEADFPGAPVGNTFYPIALVNQIVGADRDVGVEDISVFVGNRSDWFYGTSGSVPAGTISLYSVVLHEIAHGLGVIDNFDVDAGVGTSGSNGGAPLIFDRFVVDDAGVSLLNGATYPSPSAALGSRLISGPIRWSGAAGVAADGGNRPLLYAPGQWQPGTSVAHLDEATFPPGDPDSLMTPFIGSGEGIYSPGAILAGMLADMGWKLEAQTTTTTSTTLATTTTTTTVVATTTTAAPGATTTTVAGGTTTTTVPATSTTVPATTSTTTAVTTTTLAPCHPSYRGTCVPNGRTDVNCGSLAARDIEVVGPDDYHLDGDGDKIACESNGQDAVQQTASTIRPAPEVDPVVTQLSAQVTTTLAVTTTRPTTTTTRPATTSTTAAPLAKTGATPGPMVSFAVLSILSGLALMAASSRRLAMEGASDQAGLSPDQRLALAAVGAAALVLVASSGITVV